MRIDLESLQSGVVDIDLPAAGLEGNAEQHVRVRSATDLQGKLQQDSGRLQLTDVRAKEALLDALRLWFGKVLVAADRGAALRGVTTRYVKAGEHLELDLSVATLDAEPLRIDVEPTVSVAADAQLVDANLRVRGHEGSIVAAPVVLESLSVRLATLGIELPELRARRLAVGWGEGRFYLRGDGLEVAALVITAAGTTIRATDVTATELRIEEDGIAVDGLSVVRATVDVDFPTAPVEVPTEEALIEAVEPDDDSPAELDPTHTPLLDWRVLDGLSGNINLDLTVDTTVPVVQRRRATHRFRVAVDRGSIDYRELEQDLARLEDLLLDFSLRGDTLVLELGLPLLPTRGYGKPLLRWALQGQDIELARQRRVRLAVLPNPERPDADAEASPEPPDTGDDGARSPIELVELEATLRQTELRLEPAEKPLGTLLRAVSFERFRLGGALKHHRSEAASEGVLEADLRELALQLEGLPLNDKCLRLERLRLASASPCRLHLEGLRPRRAQAEVESLVIDRVSLAKR